MASTISLILGIIALTYLLAFVSSIIVIKEGIRGFIGFLSRKMDKNWKWGLLSLLALSTIGFAWSTVVGLEGNVKSFFDFLLGSFFHLSGLFLLVYLMVFIPLKIFKINRSESSQEFVRRLNYVLLPFAFVYLGGLMFLFIQISSTFTTFDSSSIAKQIVQKP